MIVTPSSFTYEYLSSLKFKELQKLSVQFHVNKRWAKKQELIENLLALKEKNETVVEEEQEWRDANTVFGDLKFKNENEGNKRLTYNVTAKSSVEHIDPHLTFEVPQSSKNLLCETLYSRETYDIPPSKEDFGVELLNEPRADFEIPPEKKVMDEVDSRATFDVFEKGRDLLENVSKSENKKLHEKNLHRKSLSHTKINIEFYDSKIKKEMGNVKNFDAKSKKREEKQEVKLLTIPYTRITRRIRAGGTIGTEKSPIKMSKKSLNIKKSTQLPITKEDFLKSPFSSVQNSINKPTIIQSVTKNQPANVTQSKLPIRLRSLMEKSKSNIDSNKENIKTILKAQLSKTADETASKKPNSTKVNFKTLAEPSSVIKTRRAVALKKTTLTQDLKERLDTSVVRTPGNKSVSKPITATKMPNFSKIHKRNFEQMDSLHDYLKKKEDRIRKLFGTPQPGQQLNNLIEPSSVFRFQSKITTDKEINGNEGLKRIPPMTPIKKKENDLKFTQKEAFKSKLRTDIKDKNRSHIHGVRTNKRFELQMKFRKM